MASVTLTAAGGAVQIAPATWRDLNALRALERVCFPQDGWPLWDLIGVLTFPNLARLKATAGGEMVGFIAGEHKPGEQIGWIATVGVLPAYRRQGIGRALMEACEAEMTTPLVRLCVRVSNLEAQRMYQGLGYGNLDIWRRYYPNGEDALVMEKRRGRR